jgi:hypothetical protein
MRNLLLILLEFLNPLEMFAEALGGLSKLGDSVIK